MALFYTVCIILVVITVMSWFMNNQEERTGKGKKSASQLFPSPHRLALLPPRHPNPLSLISLFPLLHPTHLTLLPLPWDPVKALDIHLTTKGGGRGGARESRAGSVQTLLLAMTITSAQCNPLATASFPGKPLCI